MARPDARPDPDIARLQLGRDLRTILHWHQREEKLKHPLESVTYDTWARQVGVLSGNNIAQRLRGVSWTKDGVLKAWDEESHCDGLLLMRAGWLHDGRWPDSDKLDEWDAKCHPEFLVDLRREWFPPDSEENTICTGSEDREQPDVDEPDREQLQADEPDREEIQVGEPEVPGSPGSSDLNEVEVTDVEEHDRGSPADQEQPGGSDALPLSAPPTPTQTGDRDAHSRRRRRGGILVPIVLGLAVVVVGVIVFGPFPRKRAAVPAPIPTHAVRIAEPVTHGTVCYVQLVNGTWSDLRAEEYLWLVVHPLTDPLSYPQPGPLNRAIGDARGVWNAEAFFGTGTGVGGGEEKDFELSIVAASRIADLQLRAHLASLKDTPGAGLSALPEGAVIRDTVTVRRGRC